MQTQHRCDSRLTPWLVVFVALVLSPTTLAEEGDDEGARALETDSRAPYVHRLTLYDHDGVAIDPSDESAGPYSPRATCSKCHPYAEIAGGWHFNASRASVPSGRPGEPWFLVDEQAGTALPISGRDWPGVQRPADAGLSHWEFVKRFGHHMPGGGYGEPSEAEVDAAPESLRWGISGKLEIDCMFCHSAGSQHDPAEAARQIEAENFKWAATAALGLAVVRGEARKVPDDWDPLAPPNPDFPEQSGPQLVWDLARFDPDGRVLFDITRRPPSERCYFCHSCREVGRGAVDDLARSRDVHIAAGLHCVDCHRNEMDHMIIRGYDAEAVERGEPVRAAYSCSGCHLGVAGAADPEVERGGYYGAPHPQHRGLPPVHFEKLTCTTCHSGPWPEMYAGHVQTALAHGLGLASRGRDEDDPPAIMQPVFAKQPDGRIAPQRLVSASEPYLWSFAHDVRPAAQALGAGGCTDCHSTSGAIFFGSVGDGRASVSACEFRGDDLAEARAWALGFVFRPEFKVVGVACALLLSLVLLRHVLHGFRGDVDERIGFTRSEHLFHVIAIVGVLIQFATGFVTGWIVGEMSGWVLFIHMFGAPLFIVGLTGTVLQWAPRCRFGGGGLFIWQKLLFWVASVLGLVVMSAMLAAMLPIFGYADQDALTEIHGTAALVFVLIMIPHTIVSLRARRLTREVRQS